jgi:hypothetical protein
VRAAREVGPRDSRRARVVAMSKDRGLVVWVGILNSNFNHSRHLCVAYPVLCGQRQTTSKLET